MKHFNVIGKFIGVWLLVIRLGMLRIISWPMGWINPVWRDRLATMLMKSWGAATSRRVGAELSVLGQLPTEPCFFVCNHLGYYDIILLSQVLGAVFVAKSDVKQWPLLGPVSRLMGSIYINRENPKDVVRANREIERAIAAGKTIILYPEATSSRGDKLQPIHPALLKVAADHQLPVYCGAIYYETYNNYPPAAEAICWHLESPGMIPHMWELLKMPGFIAELCIADHPVIETNRKKLAQRITQEIQSIFRPVKQLHDQKTSDTNNLE